MRISENKRIIRAATMVILVSFKKNYAAVFVTA